MPAVITLRFSKPFSASTGQEAGVLSIPLFLVCLLWLVLQLLPVQWEKWCQARGVAPAPVRHSHPTVGSRSRGRVLAAGWMRNPASHFRWGQPSQTSIATRNSQTPCPCSVRWQDLPSGISSSHYMRCWVLSRAVLPLQCKWAPDHRWAWGFDG